MDRNGAKKGAGVASFILGLLAWLGEKFAWFPAKATEAMNVLSLGLGGFAAFG
jgi:hypothetical protein